MTQYIITHKVSGAPLRIKERLSVRKCVIPGAKLKHDYTAALSSLHKSLLSGPRELELNRWEFLITLIGNN